MQKPGVPVRADEGSHHDPHGLHPQRDRQRLLSLLQVSSTILIKNLLIDFNTRSMFRNVVASMNEALDISMHLKPLASHFQVFNFFSNIDLRTVALVMKVNIYWMTYHHFKQSVSVASQCFHNNLDDVFPSQAMEAAEFNELRPLFAPMLHTVSRKRCENQIIEKALKALSFRSASSTRPASTTTRRPASSFSWRSWLMF